MNHGNHEKSSMCSRRLVAVINQWKPTAAGHQILRGANPSQADVEPAGKPIGGSGKTMLETNNPTSSEETNLAPVIQLDLTSAAKNDATKSISSCSTSQPENFTDFGTGATTTTDVEDIAQNEKNVVLCSTSTSVNCTDTICAN